MSARGWIVAGLLGAAVLPCLACCVGVLVMRDPLQRLHFVSPPTSVGATLIAVAVIVDGPVVPAGLKAIFVLLVLMLMNAVVTHAIARAIRVRGRGRWDATPDEEVRLAGTDEPLGGRRP